MSNCTGVIYGKITTAGSPAAGFEVSLNWIQKADGGTLQVGGADDLSTYTPKATTTRGGQFVLPFFWSSVQVPGSLASILAIRFASDFSYQSKNYRDQVLIGVDLRKLMGVVTPPLPNSVPSAANRFLTFYMTVKEMKEITPLRRFFGTAFISAELQGLYGEFNVDL
jgi:hypothetical protein